MKRKIQMITLAFAASFVMLSCTAFASEKEAATEQSQDLEKAVQDAEEEKAGLKQSLLSQAKELLPIVLGMPEDDPVEQRKWMMDQVKKMVKNPDQYSEDFWDSLFGTGADGISREEDSEETGKIDFVMELPDAVQMPDTYSIAYYRLDKDKNEIITLLERDEAGNIHYIDGDTEQVFVKTDEGFRMYPVLPGGGGFDEWDGTVLSARSVRSKTENFWNCADQTFIKWLGAEATEETEYLGRPCGLYHAEPGTITFTYKCDMVIDNETGVCLCYSADEVLKGAQFSVTEDNKIRIEIGDYDIGGEEMDFYCTAFETEDISFEVPEI